MFLIADAKFILDKFYENGYEAFIVGGCVRDTLLDRKLNDYDITTNAMPEKTIELFEKTIPTGLKHGTVTVIINKTPYEVTTYRVDGEYKDNRRPDDVIFVSDIKEDLARRDFTINAMAYSPYFGFKDFFNGRDDLDNRLIKAVGDADKRFNEDALRMLRAIRFSAQLNFTIEEKTYKAIKTNSSLIKNISKERINIELNKILQSNSPSLGIKMLEETNLLKNLLPVEYNKYFDKEYFKENIENLDKIKNSKYLRLCYMLETCFKNIATDEIKKILRTLKYDNKTINFVSSLNSNQLSYININSDTDLKLWINSTDRGILFDTFEYIITKLSFKNNSTSKTQKLYERTKEIIENKEPLTIKDLAIRGSDLINECNITPGKKLGETLNSLLLKVLENPTLNEKQLLLDIVKQKRD